MEKRCNENTAETKVLRVSIRSYGNRLPVNRAAPASTGYRHQRVDNDIGIHFDHNDIMTGRPLYATIIATALFLVAWVPAAAADGETCILPGTNLSAWEEIAQQEGITVYAMETPGSAIVALRATGVLDAPIDQVMEVLRRVEIAGQWMPDITEKSTIDETSDLEAVTYSINRLPWPFANRELILKNALRIDMASRFLVVDIYSVERGDLPVRKDAVRAFMHCGQTRMRPLPDNRTEMDIILFLDPRGAIPAWLANFAQRRMPYNFLRSLERKAAVTQFELRPAFRRLLDQLKSPRPSDHTATAAINPADPAHTN